MRVGRGCGAVRAGSRGLGQGAGIWGQGGRGWRRRAAVRVGGGGGDGGGNSERQPSCRPPPAALPLHPSPSLPPRGRWRRTHPSPPPPLFPVNPACPCPCVCGGGGFERAGRRAGGGGGLLMCGHRSAFTHTPCALKHAVRTCTRTPYTLTHAAHTHAHLAEPARYGDMLRTPAHRWVPARVSNPAAEANSYWHPPPPIRAGASTRGRRLTSGVRSP